MRSMVIFFKGRLKSLDQFVDAMISEFSEDYIVIDLNYLEMINEYDSLIDSNSVVITFNNIGLGLTEDISSENYWERKGVTFFNILVDHPFYFRKEIEIYKFEKLYYVCIDLGNTKYLQNMYPNRSNSFLFIPHGGTLAEHGIVHNRTIDILYVGSCGEICDIDGLRKNKDIDFIFSFFDEYYRNNSGAESFFAVKSLFDNLGMPDNKETFVSIEELAIIYEQYETSQRRIRLITYLAELGFDITVCGGGIWEKCFSEKHFDNVDFRGFISPEECVELISTAKILVNDSPFFSYGSHERVFNGMLNKTVVLTNESEYLKTRYIDGRDILYWDGWNVDEAAEKIAAILADDEYRQSLVESAFAKTTNDTWSDRAYELIQFAKQLRGE